MGWKEDNKGAGPWPFAAQPNKWGYLNNPRWLDPPVVPVSYDGREDEEPQVWDDDITSNIGNRTSEPMHTHLPCGHWHKPVAIPPTTPPPGVCIVYIDEISLDHYPYSHASNGENTSSDSMIYYQGYLYVAGGNFGVLERIDPVTMTVEQRTVFNAVNISLFKQIIIYEGVIHALILKSGYTGCWIQKITIPVVGSGNPFALSGDPMYCGSVCYGTDGKVYGAKQCLNMNATWLPRHTPITGTHWSTKWEELPGAYSYHIDPNTSVYFPYVTKGGNAFSFKISSGNYVMAHGPESGFIQTSAFYSFTNSTDGSRIGMFLGGNAVIGPDELSQPSIDSDSLASFRHTSAFTNLTYRYLDASTLASTNKLVSGLLINMVPRDNSINHRRSYWYSTNNRIYNLHTLYTDGVWRIICVDPSGTLLYQYNGYVACTAASFVILGNYVYVWSDDIKSTPSISYITKLTLNLEFVCREPCVGAFFNTKYREIGRCIVSDGVRYLYNYHRPYGFIGVITKWSTL